MDVIKGRIWKYGDDVNTDVIFPGKYTYTVTDPDQMRQHALEDLDQEFREGVRPGDVIVAGSNWGCGSSREQAVTCLKASGIGSIIAKSFARIYYRNCLNAALPALTSEDLFDCCESGDEIKVDLTLGEIVVGDQRFSFQPLPEAVQDLFAAGGLIAYTRQRLQERNQGETK